MPNETTITIVASSDLKKVITTFSVHPCPRHFDISSDQKLYYQDPETGVSGIVTKDGHKRFDDYYGAGVFECKEQIDEAKRAFKDGSITYVLNLDHPLLYDDGTFPHYYFEDLEDDSGDDNSDWLKRNQ